MKLKLLASSGLLASMLIAQAALAQTSPPSSNQPNPPAATQQAPEAKPSETATQAARTDLWRASKLVGLDVYNPQNEKIGDIKEVLIDKSGKVNGFVIGVGGFLGMGEHDVMVSMDKLKFVDEPVRTSASGGSATTTTTGTARTNATTSNGKRWYPDHAVMDATKDQLKALPEFKF
jgi:sporulation protein YlmC with PRC-barrel domain